MHLSRTSRTLRMSLAAMVLSATALVGGAGTSPAAAFDLNEVLPVLGVIEGPDAAAPVIGYTLGSDQDQTTCELLTIDWATGLTSDLPAAPSPEACATDLAVAPGGTVHGFAFVQAEPLPNATDTSALAVCAASSDFCGSPLGRFVTYAADGTATSIEVGTSDYYVVSEEPTAIFRGLAIDSNGTIFVLVTRMWVDVTTCLPGRAPVSVEGISVEDGVYNWSSCLFTLDPATGLLTLVGPSRITDATTAGLSIGSDGAWTLSLPVTDVGSVGPAAFVDLYWSQVNLLTGEVTPTGVVYSSENGFFDQLRSDSGILALLASAASGYDTGFVDPVTGQITSIVDLNTRRPPVGPTFTG